MNHGDVWTFKASDNHYKLFLCVDIYKERSPHHYIWAALTYDSDRLPTFNDAITCHFYGTGNTNNKMFRYSDQQLEHMWLLHPETKPYLLGCYGLLCGRKEWRTFKDKFSLVGNLSIVNNLAQNGGSMSNVSSYDSVDNLFTRSLEEMMKARMQHPFKIRAIINV